MVAAPLCNLTWLCDPCCDPYLLISAMITGDKKREVDVKNRCCHKRWKLQFFFTKNWNKCTHLICHETVSMLKEFNIKRPYPQKHANAHDELSGSNRAEKVKQLETVLASKQRFFMRACESNEKTTRGNKEVAVLSCYTWQTFNLHGSEKSLDSPDLSHSLPPTDHPSSRSFSLFLLTSCREWREMSHVLLRRTETRSLHKGDNSRMWLSAGGLSEQSENFFSVYRSSEEGWWRLETMQSLKTCFDLSNHRCGQMLNCTVCISCTHNLQILHCSLSPESKSRPEFDCSQCSWMPHQWVFNTDQTEVYVLFW